MPLWPAAGVGVACVPSWPGLLRGTSFDHAKHRAIAPGLQDFGCVPLWPAVYMKQRVPLWPAAELSAACAFVCRVIAGDEF